MAKKKSRGPAPSSLTKYMLCSRAAGRCQFCNKELFVDDFTLEDNNNSNLAHIVASSPDGPRGDEVRSFQLSDKIENLMLMCLDHHHLIDNNEDVYTEEVLLKMKEEHEKRVQELTETLSTQETEMVLFSSKIKNKLAVTILPKQTVKAIIGYKRPKSKNGIKIEPENINDYQSKEYWLQQKQTLKYLYDSKIANEIAFNPSMNFSIFPIAPIPLIAYFGSIIGDKISADVYQKFRVPDTWEWQSTEQTNVFETEKKILNDGNRVALVVSLTNEIVDERILSIQDFDAIYYIKATRLGVDSIKSIEDLSSFWHVYQETCDLIKREYANVTEVAVFPAIPVSAAFEIGRRYMYGVYPKLKIYDSDGEFFETLTIGE